jgi:tetratricopeptide (TPR) repeat protein
MKKAVSSFLAASALMIAPGVVSNFATGFAQAPAAQGQVQMDPAEYADYDNAVNKQTTPQTQAPAIEAYLAKSPKSAVKAEMLQRLMIDYSQIPDYAKAIATAQKVLQLDPTNFQAITIEAYFNKTLADQAADAATKQSDLDAAAAAAQQGIDAPKPASVDQTTFDAQKSKLIPTFYSTIGNDDFAKKDYAGAIKAFKAELSALPVDQTTVPGTALQDTYFIGQAYFASTPPDLIDCTFYATRAAAYAPAQFAAQMQPLATYCYKKYHGKADGYDAVVAAAKANLNPPAGFTITPAPTDADIVTQTIASTPDLSTLAITDKEYILKYGTQEQADKVFDTVKGKADKIPDATVIAASPDEVQVAYSDDAVQGKVADFDFKFKTPLKKLPDVGSKITLIGTWDSYTQKPLLITMTDSEEPAKAPVHKPVTHHK